MRLIYVPEELTFFNVLDLREVPAALRDALAEQSREAVGLGRFENALAVVESVVAMAKMQRHQGAFALALLYKAEVLRRLQRWEDALEQTLLALQGLRVQVSQTAAYNRAVAQSFEGLIHLVLRADDKARLAFAAAQEGLVDSERYWGFEIEDARVGDCRHLARWMAELLDLLPDMSSGEVTMVVPVYELVNQTLVRTRLMPLAPYQVTLSADVLRDYVPAHLVPLQVDTLSFLQLRPDAHYLALEIPSDQYLVSSSQAGDMLLLEVASPVSPTQEIALSPDIPFMRRADGRIQFRPNKQETGSFACGELRRTVGIAHALIRQEENDL